MSGYTPPSMPDREDQTHDEPQIEAAGDESPEDRQVARLLEHSIDVPVLAEAVQRQEAADAADTLEQIEEQEAVDVLVAMDERAAAEALAEMEGPLAEGVIEDLRDEDRVDYAARLIQLMAPDDAADLLQQLDDEDLREAIIREVPAAASVILRRLVAYDEETAAGLMTTNFISCRDDMTVSEATEVIRASKIPEDVNYLPVTDVQQRLVGTVGLRALLLGRSQTRVADLMETTAKMIRADLDREEVAREFDRYDLSMLPVVDDGDRLLGIVTVDDVIDIIREEQTEDVQKIVGAGAEEAVYSHIGEKIRGRLKWLVTSLFLTLGAAVVIVFYEDLIRDHWIVAVLMPVIAATVGNAGHQALAVTLRGIVLDEVRRERVWPLLAREGAVGLLNGLAVGLIIFGVVAIASLVVSGASWQIGLVAGVALAASMGAGTLAGSAIPLVMRRLGADPAQSSAIFLIMLTDGAAFATFLGLASFMARWIEVVP
ncbi:MAG: magnesium transporter [Planctomycetes bacterium]|nr:magnesium transporter [Planctomycetota bacterium]